MAVPKRKVTSGRRDRRRAHHAIQGASLSKDKMSNNSVHLSHHVDLNTGFYKGKQVLFVEDEDETQAED